MKVTKIDAMHRLYGKEPGARCKDCCNLQRYTAGVHTVMKCKAYGATGSEATDWRAKYTACGLYNIPFEIMSLPAAFYLTERAPAAAEPPLPGQMRLEV